MSCNVREVMSNGMFVIKCDTFIIQCWVQCNGKLSSFMPRGTTVFIVHAEFNAVTKCSNFGINVKKVVSTT